jgi:hypothetical protein
MKVVKRDTKVIKMAESIKLIWQWSLNGKVDHRSYQCDHTAWVVELAKIDRGSRKL